MIRAAAIAAAVVLALGAALRTAWPYTAASGLAAAIAMAMAAQAAGRGARARHRALMAVRLRPGGPAHWFLSGRVAALGEALGAALAVLPAAYLAVTAGAPELALAAATVIAASLAFAGFRRFALTIVQPAFAAPVATWLALACVGPVAIAAFTWAGYALIPPPAALAEPTLAAAIATDLSALPGHWLAQPVAAARAGEITVWWYLDATGYALGPTLAILVRNALVALALIRLSADIGSRHPEPAA